MKRQGRGKKKIILGITGIFGSGKTAVARLFKPFGAEIIDADKIAHRLIKPETKIYKKIIYIFGEDIIDKGRAIDRNKLAAAVFGNKNLLKKLNRLIHPQVISIIKQKIKASDKRVIILDAPLLIEAGLEKIVDKLIVVSITRERQIERLVKRTKLKAPDILKRIRAQIPLRNKVRLADFVIDNSGTARETKKQVGQIRRLLWKN